MSKMSPEERQRRRSKVATEALESVAKSEQFNFRMEAETIKRLYKRAELQGKPVGALVREWVIEKLDEQDKAPSSEDLLQEIHILQKQTKDGLDAISKKIGALKIG
jgi:predicted DNA-binding protein